MTINEWIADYAEDNDIDIPDGIGDINAMINFLQLNGSGGGSSLPSVTSADEGKVLAVNASGEWAAEVKNNVIYFTVDENTTLNATWQEIHDYLINGQPVAVLDNYSEEGISETVVSYIYGAYYDAESENKKYWVVVVNVILNQMSLYGADNTDEPLVLFNPE